MFAHWLHHPRVTRLQARFAALGYQAQAQGTPFHGRVIFRVVPANDG